MQSERGIHPNGLVYLTECPQIESKPSLCLNLLDSDYIWIIIQNAEDDSSISSCSFHSPGCCLNTSLNSFSVNSFSLKSALNQSWGCNKLSLELFLFFLVIKLLPICIRGWCTFFKGIGINSICFQYWLCDICSQLSIILEVIRVESRRLEAVIKNVSRSLPIVRLL